jgi:hypothetical protein
MEPSAKGIVVVGVVDALQAMTRAGKTSRDALAARLGAAALTLLEEKVEVSRWYPMTAFSELVELEWELVGRDVEYEWQAGARFADRSRQTGLYQQVEYAASKARPSTREELLRQSKLVVTVTSALYNFITGSVRVSEAGDRLEIVYGNAAAFPEPMRFLIEGFLSRVNEWQGSSRRWTSTRVRPDEIVYAMPLSRRFASA